MASRFKIGRSALGVRRSAFHRSLTFWLGLVFFLCMISGWVDSTRCGSSFGARLPGSRDLEIGSNGGILWLDFAKIDPSTLFHPMTGAPVPPPSPVRIFRNPPDAFNPSNLFPPKILEHFHSDHTWGFRIAWFLVIFLYLSLWISLLGWRHHRMRKRALPA